MKRIFYILCHAKGQCKDIFEFLPLKLREKFEIGKIHVVHKGLITTYHSSKGLEAKYCKLEEINKFYANKKNRTLMYVGMTRASERLTIHYETIGGFVEEISGILN